MRKKKDEKRKKGKRSELKRKLAMLADSQRSKKLKKKNQPPPFESQANSKHLREVPEQNQTQNLYTPQKSNYLSKSAYNYNAK